MFRNHVIAAIIIGSCVLCAAPDISAQPARIGCSPPAGVQTSTQIDDLPLPIQKSLHELVGDISPVGGPFNATDALTPGKGSPHFRRLLFAWKQGKRWIVATERGGIAYNNPVFAFDLSADGRTTSFLQQQTAFPGDVCQIAMKLLSSALPSR